MCEEHSNYPPTPHLGYLVGWLIETRITPVQIINTYDHNTDTCFKSSNAQGTCLHCAVKLSVNIPLSSKKIMLQPRDLTLNPQEHTLVNVCCTVGKEKDYVFTGLNNEAPPVGTWVKNVAQCMSVM